MKELNELEAGVVRLKRNEEQQRRIINTLEQEKQELIKRSNMFSEKLNKMQESYHEASQKMMDFVKNQIDPMKERLAEIGVELKSIDDIENNAAMQRKREEKNETIINKIINEMNLMQKELESIQILKTGLRDQSKSLDETRREIVGELDRNIDAIKKDFETKRVEDIKNQMSEFKKEIKRIAGIEEEFRAYKKTQDSAFYKMTQSVADLESTLSEIRLLRKRSESNEEFSKRLDSKLEKLSRFQGDSLADLRTELLKDLHIAADSIRKEFDEKRVDDNKSQLQEFRSELGRISNIEEEMRGYKKSQDSELFRLSKTLEDAPADIKILKQKLSEADVMLKGFAQNSINRSEFSDLFSNLNKRLEDSENRLFSLDKRFGNERASIEKQIIEIVSDEKVMNKNQGMVRKAIAERIAEIDSRMSGNLKTISDHAKENSVIIERIKDSISGIAALEENSDAIENFRGRLTKIELISKQISENQDLLENVRNQTQKIDIVTKEIPKRVDSVEHSIGKINEAKEILSERSQALGEQLKTLEESMSNERERIAAIEKEFGVTDKKKESRLDMIDRDIGDVRNALAEIDVVRSRLNNIDQFSKVLDEKLGKGLKQVRLDVDKRIDEEKADQLSRLSNEMKRLSELATGMDGYSKSQEKRFDSVQKDIISLQDTASSVPGMGSDIDNMKTALQQNLSDSKGLRADHDSVSKQVSDNLGTISSIKERIVALDLAVSDVRKNQNLISKIKDRIADIDLLPEHENQIKMINERLSAMAAPVKAISDHEAEIKNLSEKISSLKPLMDSVGKHDSDIEEFSKTLVRLESVSKTVQESVDNIHSMRDRVTRIENVVGDVSDNTKSVDDLEERVTGMEAVVSQIPKTMDMVQKIKEMIANIKLLPKTIEELSAVKERVVSIEMGTKILPDVVVGIEKITGRISDIESNEKLFNKEMIDHRKYLDKISDEQKAITSSIKSEINQRFKDQKVDEGSLLDDIEKLGARITSIESNEKIFSVFSEQLKSLEDSLSDERQRIVAIEKEFGVTDKKKESRLDIILQDISAIRQEIDNQRRYAERLSNEQKTIIPSLHSEIDKKIKQLSKDQKDINLSIQNELDKKTEQLSHEQKDANLLLQNELDEKTNQLSKEQKNTNLLLQAEIDEKVKELSRQVSEARKEQSGLHMKDIKTWLSRTKEIEKALNSYMSGNEKRIDKLSEGLISMDDEIRAQAIISNNLTKSLTKLDGTIADVEGMKERMSYLTKMSEGLGRDSVAESEFIQTVKSISKRIDDIKSNNNNTDSKLASEVDENKDLINKTLSDMSMLRVSQDNIQAALGNRLTSLEKSLSGDLSGLTKEAETSLAEINKIKERISGLGNLDEIVKGSVAESEFTQAVKSINKRIDDLESENTSFTEKLRGDDKEKQREHQQGIIWHKYVERVSR